MADLDQDVTQKRKQFGNRFLTDPKNVFEHNAWDNVVWDEEQEKEARSKAEEQLAHRASEEDFEKYEKEADENWNKFYEKHDNKFFKDRHWLFTEFPELAPEAYLSKDKLLKLSAEDVHVVNSRRTADDSDSQKCQLLNGNCDTTLSSDKQNEEFLDNSCDPKSDKCQETQKSGNLKEPVDNESVKVDQGLPQKFPGESAHYRIFEVGCGVGNTVFPILQANNDPDLMVYCCDYSSTAVDLVKENKDYDKKRCHAFVCDISNQESSVPFPDGSLDIIILIFVLSANCPERFQEIINRLARFLKPGGMILFRDYGRYDMAQLRFKKGKCLGENFYVRGDGTRVYFFTQDELRDLMTKAGLREKQNLVDRRLQVNRGLQKKMYRVWIQCKYFKPLENER